MSVSAPSRRIAGRCFFCQPLPSRTRERPFSVHHARRVADETGNRPNPVLEEWRRNNPTEAGQAQQQQQAGQMSVKAGDLSASSIFEDDRRAQAQVEQLSDSADAASKTERQERNPAYMLRVLDPDPNSRERWERKKVIQQIRKGGRMSKTQMIKRTEREHLAKSHNMKTSVKKLGMLARQIAGKTLDDAIAQMRFSKKKVAEEVLKHLEYARDEAVVMRGMGLASMEGEKEVDKSTALLAGEAPVDIQLKDGKRHKISDTSKIYVDEAWVGRGPFGQLPDFRARGQVNIMRTPWTSLSIRLKEEKTRVREWEEREAKRKEKAVGTGLWTHLPDRPVQWAKPYYTF